MQRAVTYLEKNDKVRLREAARLYRETILTCDEESRLVQYINDV